jgi:hypothetical protein
MDAAVDAPGIEHLIEGRGDLEGDEVMEEVEQEGYSGYLRLFSLPHG